MANKRTEVGLKLINMETVEEDREKARQEYLDRRGVRDGFRW